MQLTCRGDDLCPRSAARGSRAPQARLPGALPLAPRALARGLLARRIVVKAVTAEPLGPSPLQIWRRPGPPQPACKLDPSHRARRNRDEIPWNLIAQGAEGFGKWGSQWLQRHRGRALGRGPQCRP